MPTGFEKFVIIFCLLMVAGFFYGLAVGDTRYSVWDITLIVVLVTAALAVRKQRLSKQSPAPEAGRPAPPARTVGEPATSAPRSAPVFVAWDDSSLRVASDSPRTARYRALQSWYREVHLRVPPGLDGRGRVIASMLPAEEVARRPGLNFLTPEGADYANQRSGEVLRTGGTLEEDRLRRNMLSSMPLCFNIFGPLRAEPVFAAVVSEVFDIDAASVDTVECEWAPDKALHLNDRTAFDAFVEYRDSAGRLCFLAIETKYTEPFSRKQYDSELYQRVTETTGYFRAGAGNVLKGPDTNQLWRMAMLAASMLHRGDFDHGSVAVLSLADDRHAKVAVEGVRNQIVDESFVKFASLEDLAAAAGRHEALDAWAGEFTTRYLDLSPVNE